MALPLASAGSRQHELLATVSSPYRAWVGRYVARARQRLGADAAAAWAAGQALSLDQAVTYALGDADEDSGEPSG